MYASIFISFRYNAFGKLLSNVHGIFWGCRIYCLDVCSLGVIKASDTSERARQWMALGNKEDTGKRHFRGKLPLTCIKTNVVATV